MSERDLSERLRHDAAKVECPICRHRQWTTVAIARCDQCGSEIRLFDERADAESALEALGEERRVAYLTELADGIFAVVANRKFGSG